MWRPSGRARRPKGSTAGCSTISTASIRSRPTSRRRPPGRTSRDPALVLPDSRTGEPRGLVHAIERAFAGSPAGHRPSVTRAASSSRRGSRQLLAACGGWRWNTRRAARFPTSSRVDAGTIELVRECRRRGGVVRRPGPAVRGGLGRRRRSRRIVRPPTSSTASRIARSRRWRAATARRRGDDRVRHSAADGRLVSGRGAGQRLGAERVGRRKTPAIRTTCRPRRSSRRDSRATSWCCSTSGASWIGRARSLLTSPGSAITGARCPSGYVAGVRGGARRAGCRDRARAARGAGAARTCAAGEVDRAASAVLRERRLRRPHPAPHRPQPRRDRCTATA